MTTDTLYNEKLLNEAKAYALDKGSAVREGEAFDVQALTQWLRKQGIDVKGVPRVTQFAGGASNWTYRLQYDNQDLI